MSKRTATYLFVLLLSLPLLAQEIVFYDGFENHDPEVISSPPLTGSVGEPYSYDVDAIDIDGDELLYLLDSAPSGMTIDAVSGLIEWTPGSAGEAPVIVTVTDGNGGSTFQSWTIVVSEGQDSDSDGLSDVLEDALGTDPGDPDSDDDDLLDGQEVNTHQTNPLDPDTDNDRLSDGEEVNTHGTLPLKLDSDDDHFGDGLELDYGTDPLDGADFPAGPPDPESTATPIDQTIVSNLPDTTAFLYNGTPPIQTGVADGVIRPEQAAVVHGRVMNRDGLPLPGAEITISGHTEYGQTFSRIDGHYDMAVNGGGLLTVNINKSGYLSAQRQANVPWRDYLEFPDIILVPLDTAVSAVDLDMGEIQMATASPVSDADGDRQAVLMFPSGTTAELILEGGGTQPANSLNVRATEYTVGDNGPEAMPGGLPPASGYTYAVELSVDEAMTGGVSGIQFSQPLYSYTENFLGFPVGSAVPTGYYDKEASRWISSQNGRVIKIIGITESLADVDVDGDDVADTGTTLSDLGFTDDERQSLADSYTVGQQLWRVPVQHFTPWDYNWPYGPPLGALPPLQPPPVRETQETGCGIIPSVGSIIEVQNQVVRQEIPIAGTPYTLTYSSSDVPGRTTNRTLNISLSGDSVPASLKRIELELSIAGQMHRQAAPPQPHQATTFTWNGQDAYKRSVSGLQKVTGAIGYVYEAVYYEPDELEQVFNRFGVRAVVGVEARQELTFYQPIRSVLGNLDARGQGLGGWRLDVHQVYDPVAGVLVNGAGTPRGASPVFQGTVSRVAGEEDGFSGDGGPAIDAFLNRPEDVAVLPEGGILIADSDNNRIRMIDADGIITTIAGDGTEASTGDGGPATLAGVDKPIAVGIAPDGSIYIVEWGHRIRKVSTDGIISTIAGNGIAAHSGDGGPAASAQISYPRGIAIAHDGTVYFAENGTARVRQISPNGIIDTIAGTGVSAYSGDGGAATMAGLRNALDVALGPEGRIFIASETRVRVIGTDGVIETVAGNGTVGFSGDGGPAGLATLHSAQGLAVGSDALYIADGAIVRKVDSSGTITSYAGVFDAPEASGDGGPPLAAGFEALEGLSIDADNRLYLTDRSASHIRRVEPTMPGFSSGNFGIASQNGSLYYEFQADGKHLRTYQSLTGAVLYDFGYDSNGLLKTVTDGFGKTTTILRNGVGEPTAIVGHFGQQTALMTDINGYLSTITNPAGEQVQIDSSPSGLITRWEDPRGKVSAYTYDDKGRLVSQSDNGGFSQTFDRSPDAAGWNVSRTTGLSRVHDNGIVFSGTGVQQNTSTAPDGSQSTAVFNSQSGVNQVTIVNGMSRAIVEGPDPRFGMQSPIISSAEITAPGGPTFVATSAVEASLSNPADPFSLVSMSDTSTVDGRTTTSIYTAATRTQALTSPEGRLTTTVIDDLGRVVSRQFGDLAPLTNSFNLLGQLEMITRGSGETARVATVSYGPDGFRSGIIDPIGRQISYTRDAAGRITNKFLPGAVDIVFGYNNAGELESITPPGQPEHVLSYTVHGRIASITPPFVSDTGPTSFTYNDDGQPLTITHPGNEEISFAYDAYGRVQTIALSEGGVPAATYTLSYLLANQLDTISGPGAQTVSYSYQGGLITGETWGGVVEGSLNWTYDDAFRLSSETVSGGDTVAFGYDGDDLLISAGDFSIIRDAVNGLAQSTSLGVVEGAWTYNEFGEVESNTVSANMVDVYNVSYTRDDLGRITQKVETIGGVTDTYDYAYDLLGQLIEVRKNTVIVESYDYDNNGNRLSGTVNTLTSNGAYDDQDRLISYGGNAYDYSPAGRLQTLIEPGDAVTTYDYDVVGNLLSVTLPDATMISYGQDGPDRRVQRTVDGAITHRYLYDADLPVAELDELNNVVSQFIYAGGGAPAYLIKDGVNYRYVTDQVGSVRLLVNAVTGDIAQRIDYDSFGVVISDSNPGFQPFGFAGGIYDPATALVRFGTRDYDAVSGRWTAKDTISFGGNDTNLYRYAGNNPVNFVDNLGMGFWDKVTGFLNGAGEFSAHRNWAAIFHGLGGGMGLLLYEGLDLLFGFDEPHIGDLLPEPTTYDGFSDYYDYELVGSCTAAVAEFALDSYATGPGLLASKAAGVAKAEANAAAEAAARRLEAEAARRGSQIIKSKLSDAQKIANGKKADEARKAAEKAKGGDMLKEMGSTGERLNPGIGGPAGGGIPTKG